MKSISTLLTANVKRINTCTIGIIGPAGVGKSDIIIQAAAKAGRPIVELRAGYMTPGEFLGNPKAVDVYDKEGKLIKQSDNTNLMVTKYAIPYWLLDILNTPDCILVLEELTNASPDVIGAMYELILDRKINNIKLPDTVTIIFTGNRSEDAMGIAGDLPSTIRTRAFIIEINDNDVIYDEWKEWAFTANVRNDIIGFLYDNQNALLCDPIPNKSYSTPRTWAILSKALNDLDALFVDKKSDEYINLAKRTIWSIIPDNAANFEEYFINGLTIKHPLEYIKGNEQYVRNQTNTFMTITFNICDYVFKHTKELSTTYADDWKSFCEKLTQNELVILSAILPKSMYYTNLPNTIKDPFNNQNRATGRIEIMAGDIDKLVE